MNKIMYYVTYDYTFPNLSEFEVEKETEKRIYINRKSIKRLLGGFGLFFSYLVKDDRGLFETLPAALDYLINRADHKISDAERNKQLAEKNKATLIDLRNTLLGGEQTLDDFLAGEK